MAGRPRTSAAILALRGSFTKDPQRARVDAPGAAPWTDEVPPNLQGAEIAAWREVVGSLPKVALTATERVGVEQMARLLAALRATSTADPNFTKLDARLGAWAVQMGMTLQARAKLGTSGKQKGPNKYQGAQGQANPAAGDDTAASEPA